MNISARRLRANLWWASTKSVQAAPPTSLRAFLQNQAVTARQLLAAGRIRSNVSNAHTTDFDSEGMTAEEVVDMWVYLVETFDLAVTELGGTPSDAAVQAQMELNLRPIAGATGLWMYIQK